ncbi:hypothetical protein CW700_04050 [Candidatus Bathyarchaeota archaeon]|nr:MAG: hypothetical protein CW700_04050 [Candidatus Bathyarchaeota archaeon]
MSGYDRSVYPTFGISRTLLIALLFIGALSLLSLYLGFDAYLSDHPARASLYLLMGTSGFALIGYMFFRSRSTIERIFSIPQVEVVTTLECKTCGLKKIRPFRRGDYLFKEADECTRCKGKMNIVKIYGRERAKAR